MRRVDRAHSVRIVIIVNPTERHAMNTVQYSACRISRTTGRILRRIACDDARHAEIVVQVRAELERSHRVYWTVRCA